MTAPEAAALRRRFHGGPPIPGRFDAFRVVEAYAATAAGAGVSLPLRYTAAKAIADRIEARRGTYAHRPCHNDLLAANFIHGERLWIVDWEYAGMGDPAFDLANFAVNNGLDELGDRALLDAYGGGDARIHLLMRYMSDFREAMWGVVQQAISNLDFDFDFYASEHSTASNGPPPSRASTTRSPERPGAQSRLGRAASGLAQKAGDDWARGD